MKYTAACIAVFFQLLLASFWGLSLLLGAGGQKVVDLGVYVIILKYEPLDSSSGRL